MKEWKCVQVGHHRDVAETIQEHQEEGWLLHTYTTAYFEGAIKQQVNHYLLFYHEAED